MDLKNRLNKVRQKLAEREIDALFVSRAENRYYLSGFDGSDGFLLITPQDTILATDSRYIEQAGRQAPGYQVFQITNDVADWFPRLVAGLNLKKLGFEAEDITFARYQQMTDALNKAKSRLKLVSIDRLVESLRAIKEPEEIEFITKASAITDSAFEYIESIIRVGLTEKEVAWEIEKFIREECGQSLAFEFIVASGPNSALPHAQPSQHAVTAGEPIVIDIGTKVEGYRSDLTRTICLGPDDDTFKKVYDTVLRSQLAAIAAIKEGMTGEEADNSARRVVEQAGYGKGEVFGYALGHGVGLAIHELPRLGSNSKEPLVDGMIFTIEPGIYLSGWGGVRIEDTVIMENGKIKVISRARKL